MQAPPLFGSEPYHLTATVGAAPAAASDAVLVFHSSDPTLQVFTDKGVLDSQSTVTDGQGATFTVHLYNQYKPVTAGESFTRQISLYEQQPMVPLTVTAQVVDHSTGQMTSSSAVSTVSPVYAGALGQWQAPGGVQGYNTAVMPLAQQTRLNQYALSFFGETATALPGAYPVLSFTAARLKAAGYTAQQLAGALEVKAVAGLGGGSQPVVAPVIGADGSLSYVLPAADLPASDPNPDRFWQLTFYATCGIAPGTVTGSATLHAADGTVVGGMNQTFAIARHACLTHDFTSDGKADLLARDRSGVLWLYPGTGHSTTPYGARVKVGGGWNVYTTLVAAGDLTGDGRDDLLARDSAGRLWLYRGTGQTTRPFLPRVAVSLPGYHPSARLVAGGALFADGQADVADAASGLDFHGTGSASDPLSDIAATAPSLGSYKAVAGAGVVDWTPRFAARDSGGVLWLVGDPDLDAPTPARVRVGGGWQIYNSIVQSGDATSSGHDDLVARDASGHLWLYAGTGNSGRAFLPRTLVSGGWQVYDLLV
ncbi:FG-GAP repeat domain-containing protein [Streptacidiphilus jiangxiensis]|uniref:Repeat domain-containing protein n=1 Tax=Streptacidiphilus jiangxiensis TaxID=235985 RepID=A0A1H7WA60_STRJI|nr:VCBS repeat-containing protein [Streptacidiphilus jiangxiensis]SEM18472.1 Repeat domain-containing protein [Streptacidiphilus jiangxiensis]